MQVYRDLAFKSVKGIDMSKKEIADAYGSDPTPIINDLIEAGLVDRFNDVTNEVRYRTINPLPFYHEIYFTGEKSFLLNEGWSVKVQGTARV